jgi:hypothetical protein
MKNSTRMHERDVVEYLSTQGCTSIRFEEGSIVALRSGEDGQLYPLSIDIYEDKEREDGQRFRARVARRFGLPVSLRHGFSVRAALGAIQWRNLDHHQFHQQLPLTAEIG